MVGGDQLHEHGVPRREDRPGIEEAQVERQDLALGLDLLAQGDELVPSLREVPALLGEHVLVVEHARGVGDVGDAVDAVHRDVGDALHDLLVGGLDLVHAGIVGDVGEDVGVDEVGIGGVAADGHDVGVVLANEARLHDGDGVVGAREVEVDVVVGLVELGHERLEDAHRLALVRDELDLGPAVGALALAAREREARGDRAGQPEEGATCQRSSHLLCSSFPSGRWRARTACRRGGSCPRRRRT